jgi:SWI/SNF-related matrix-associated actin-dependent regulator of chromatin subfamily A-like protein 1
MLTFDATPARVREATKLAYRLGVSLQGVQAFWDAQPRVTEIPNFSFKLKPYQADGVAHLEKWDGNALIGDEPGLGKTSTVMAYAFKHRRFPMCVILPKTLLLNWRREITLMLGSQLRVLIVGFVPSQRRLAQLLQQYPHVHYSRTPLAGYDVTLINYDIVARNQADLESVGYDYVVVDESHKVKSIAAQRTRAIIRLVTGREEIKGKRNQWRVLHDGVRSVTFMTGTPMLSRPSELWTTVSTIADWVPQFSNFFKFASLYCNAHKTRFGWDFTGHSNEAELNQLLTDTIMIRRRKADVLRELPAKTFVTVPLEFDRREYDAVAAAFEGRGDWKQGMQKLVQYGGNPAKSDDAIVAINKCREIAALSKLDSAAEWVVNFVESGQKIVVFAHHRHVIMNLKAAIEAHNEFEGSVATIMGGFAPEERNSSVESFQNDPATKVIIISHSAGGYGITLTASSHVAFVELPWSPSDFSQCCDRVHRIGQINAVTVYMLAAEDTVEDDIFNLLVDKSVVVDTVIDGQPSNDLHGFK